MRTRFVDDAISDLHICSFLRMYMDEVTSTIPSLVIDLDHYKVTIIERFGNRLIKDAISRICEDGSSKFFNTLRDALMVITNSLKY
jgi:mannitol 2-dehydrogenase